ncbi:MAG TPA: hypothetical protein VKX17_27245 [Planctomycetota bacterium]|nr:hypothetical protein [Planctomycetota bacterium]
MPESATVTGPAREWLSSRREDLNARFRMAKRRFVKLDSQAVLALTGELLPPLAGNGEAGSDELLSEIFDLILLHAGRGLLAQAPSPMRALLAQAFPRLRAVLIQRPRLLPSALSNAVENVGARGAEFAHALSAMAEHLQNAEQLQDAGVVLAWRLGEARLREQALKAATQIPNVAALIALGLDGWPHYTAPLAVAALIGDAWCHPRERIRPQTLLDLTHAPRERIFELLDKLAAPAPVALPMTPAAALELRLSGTCGEFAGYGGYFLEPPKLLYVGRMASRHRFWVRSGTTNYRIDADVFGWVCKPDPSADFPLNETFKNASALKKRAAIDADKPALLADGLFFSRGHFEKIGDLNGASSFNICGDVLAATLPDSFRVRVYSPARPVLT